jgi:small subunit ribosomal protein S3
MEEKKFVKFKQDELGIKEYVKHSLGKGRISDVNIEYTPVGEKIVIATNRPGLVIGKKGEKIEELTAVLRKRFNLDNPHIDIREITNEALDAQLVADSIAIQLERKGSLKFKIIAYKALDSIMKAGALGVELALSGKLPSERAKTWRFTQGYLKKTGDPSKVVNKATAQARTQMGVIGIKVSILPPDAHIHDQIKINDSLLKAIAQNKPSENVEPVKKKTRKKKEASE